MFNKIFLLIINTIKIYYNNEEYLKLYEDRLKKLGIGKSGKSQFHSKVPAFSEGKLAFSNDIKLSDNPYAETNSELALIWETGWKEAFEAEKLFIEETKTKAIKSKKLEEINNEAIYKIGFLITAIIVFFGIWICSGNSNIAIVFALMAGVLWPFFWPFVAVIIIGIAYFIYKTR